MKVTFDYLDEFERGAKALRKKYPSFENDFPELVLAKAERVFDNSHRSMESRYHLRHGIFKRA